MLCGGVLAAVDQRGVHRPQGEGCDRGALEVEVAEPKPEPTPEPTVDPTQERPEFCDPDPIRIADPTRVETALCASAHRETADAVVLARADDFADAQAGTPLAIALDAPLLLTQPDSLHPATADELSRLLPSGAPVYLLGGTAALSQGVADQIVDLGLDPVRYGGANRFATAAAIAQDGLNEPSTVLVADGGDFRPAVVAGAASLAAGGTAPAAVLLTAGGQLPPETAAYLDDRPDITAVTIGTAAGQALPGADNHAGASAIDTAIVVAEAYVDQPTVVAIATTADFADALAGGALVGNPVSGPGPMLLTDP
ncbi:MAG TPA: cell wall-binding repeat-containing protein, partial [Euzebya sp.]|nr:cell wall-binding repeat-containing protein [Euzebya sp.]